MSTERVHRIARAEPGCGLTTTSEAELSRQLADGRLCVRGTSHPWPRAHIHILCVPTPAGTTDGADLGQLRDAVDSVAGVVRAGDLVLIQSTCPPGTIDRSILPRLVERVGLTPGVGFHVAHSPVRIDPGTSSATLWNVPRVVAGATPACADVAARFLRRITEYVLPVATIHTAELVKVFENTFRLVNISLVNELAALCSKSDVDVLEVLTTAATKPYGFLGHRPGPGAGGDCVPVSAGFFSAAARRHGVPSSVVDAAIALNDAMPARVLSDVARLLAARGLRPLRGSRVLVVGVTYKPDVANVRRSAAVRVVERLRSSAVVDYHDPHVPQLRLCDGTELRSRAISETSADIALVLTRHAVVDHDSLSLRVAVVVDCSGGAPHLLAEPGDISASAWSEEARDAV
jgi:UDP-N-acetyl-D-glucosamine dehydrogenase